jgi:hypothetical protein
MTDEDEDLIGSGRAVELLEVWQGHFRGSRLVKAGTAPSCTCTIPYPRLSSHLSPAIRMLLQKLKESSYKKHTAHEVLLRIFCAPM